MSHKYRHAVLGGTFDRFHLGHQSLVSKALELSDEVLIGVTVKELNQKKILTQIILDYDTRVQELAQYILSKSPHSHFGIFPLADPFGQSITDPNLDAIVVSPLTLSGASAVNHRRAQNSLKPIAIEVADLVLDESGEHLSSTRIRQGLVNRQGQVFQELFIKDLHLTKSQIDRIRRLQAELIDPNHLTVQSLTAYPDVALVGDQVTEYFATREFPFHQAIIDYHSGRQPYSTKLGNFQPIHNFTVDNPASSILFTASQIIFDVPKNQTTLITVNGEEDLLGFPLGLSIPLGSALFYGQPGKGIARLILTEDMKNYLARIIHST
jgi:pantetheine-phosphate adenylyltransferase